MSRINAQATLRTGAALLILSGSFLLAGPAVAAPETMSVQIDDVGPLAQAAPAPVKPLTFQNTMYQAAPMPDEDVSAPPGAVQTEAQLGPKILSPRTIIQGDGYANGSSQQGSIAARKSGAPGLGLSVPVN